MTQKYFSLLATCKKVSDETREMIERLEFWCWVSILSKEEYEKVISVRYTAIWWTIQEILYSDWEIRTHYWDIKTIWGKLTISQFVGIFRETVALIWNTLYSVIFYDCHNIDNFLIEFEPWKELWEQSDETLERCEQLVKEVFNI